MSFWKRNPITRALRWKRYVETALAEQFAINEKLELELDFLTQDRLLAKRRHDLLQKRVRSLTQAVRDILVGQIAQEEADWSFFAPDLRQSFTRRGGHVRMLAYEPGAEERVPIGSSLADELADASVRGEIADFEAARLHSDGTKSKWLSLTSILTQMQDAPELFRQIFLACEEANVDLKREKSARDYFSWVSSLTQGDPDYLEFAENARPFYVSSTAETASDQPEHLALDWRPPYSIPAAPMRRSAVFLHNNYYHFGNVAAALRDRGWDALTVSVESPDSPQRQFFHGEDLNLFDSDPVRMRARVAEFFKTVPERFGVLQFYGRGHASFFPDNFENGSHNEKIPWDFLELRRHRLTMGYSPAGCMDESFQSSIHKVTGGLCDRCIWQTRPDVCSDAGNAAWKEKIDMLCDWVALEGDWITPETAGTKFVRGPAITALDPQKWNPDIEVPERFRLERKEGELLVYHAVGNYLARRQGDRDIKGTGAVLAAVDRLKAEGWPLRLFFATDIPGQDVRFYQVQADIVVDQLNYGRLGANARESLMLGRPLITNISAGEVAPLPYVLETPAVHATEVSVYAELKALLADRDRRQAMAKTAREFAVKWHASDVCAARFENIIDRLSRGLPPEERALDRLDFVEKRH